MKTLIVGIGLMFITSSIAVHAQQTPVEVHRVQLCDVVRNPKEFAGKRIGVEAFVVNDKGTTPMLTSTCQFGIRAVIDEQNLSERDLTVFEHLLKRGPIGTGQTDVSGMFIGTFEYLDASSSYKLHLEHVEKMKVKHY
jgi:hypothetical protein